MNSSAQNENVLIFITLDHAKARELNGVMNPLRRAGPRRGFVVKKYISLRYFILKMTNCFAREDANWLSGVVWSALSTLSTIDLHYAHNIRFRAVPDERRVPKLKTTHLDKII